MALRLIELILSENENSELPQILKEKPLIELMQISLPEEKVLVRILSEAEQTEAILDALSKKFVDWEERRMVILPVQATYPRYDVEEEEASQEQNEVEAPPERINREELYEEIQDAAKYSFSYMFMVFLSTLVAIVALHRDSVAVLIGAMVIAPLLGPSIALALGTTLGDIPLLRRASLTTLIGIAITLALSSIAGFYIQVDPAASEVASRTQVGLGDIVVAFASGCAGALALATGLSAILIGVMVSVSLLPPLVLFGLLLGGGRGDLAMGALSLFLTNLICINLAGVITFLVQGIQPATWWEKDRAVKATRVAIALWIVFLLALFSMIYLIHNKTF